MNAPVQSQLPQILEKHETDLLAEWIALQSEELTGRRSGDERQLRDQAREFLTAFRTAAARSPSTNVKDGAWSEVRSVLERITNVRLQQGLTPSEVATFVLSFKQPLFARLRSEFGSDAQKIGDETWYASVLIDKVGLYTTEVYQKTRNEIIQRQQEEMLELSTPVVQLWEGILALPLIGTLDSARTQVVMQNLLEAIVEREAQIAIIDITGVPTVDTLVAHHLLKTVAAARLMGADCIISGIRPQIAQTIIHLGVDLSNVMTKATLSDAFATALRRSGAAIVKTMKPGPEEA